MERYSPSTGHLQLCLEVKTKHKIKKMLCIKKRLREFCLRQENILIRECFASNNKYAQRVTRICLNKWPPWRMERERARTELAWGSVRVGSVWFRCHTDHIQSVSEPQVWLYSAACSQPTTPDFKRDLSFSVYSIFTMLWTANTIMRKFSSSSVSNRIFCIVVNEWMNAYVEMCCIDGRHMHTPSNKFIYVSDLLNNIIKLGLLGVLLL